MKQIQKEIKSYVTVYEAIDGTTFNSSAECEKYENSARVAIMTQYKPLIVKSTTEWALFNMGSDDSLIDIVKVTCEEDINILLTAQAYYNGDHRIDEMRNHCKKALEQKDFLIITRGDEYSETFWIAGTVYDRLNHIISYIDPTTTIRYEDVED